MFSVAKRLTKRW